MEKSKQPQFQQGSLSDTRGISTWEEAVSFKILEVDDSLNRTSNESDLARRSFKQHTGERASPACAFCCPCAKPNVADDVRYNPEWKPTSSSSRFFTLAFPVPSQQKSNVWLAPNAADETHTPLFATTPSNRSEAQLTAPDMR